MYYKNFILKLIKYTNNEWFIQYIVKNGLKT
jgi:hypothetical protein